MGSLQEVFSVSDMRSANAANSIFHGSTPVDPFEGSLLAETTEIHKKLMRSIEQSLGSSAYRHYFQVTSQGEVDDLVEGGDRACAFYVSRILTKLGLLPCAHLRVSSTLECMVRNGWELDESPRNGDVVAWGALGRQHIGMVVGPDLYVSNSSEYEKPIVHPQVVGESPTYLSHPEATAEVGYHDPVFILAELRQ